jgi:hypothetical protein
MPSLALKRWRAERAAALDEIENVHRSVGGTGRRRHATMQQLNHAYALLLSSELQGFCRDLHTECAVAIARTLPSTNLQYLMRDGLVLGRKLDVGNPNPGNIGADFNRFGPSFWTLVDAAHPRNLRQKTLLERMNRWRNAIAHNTFEPGMLRRGRPVLSRVEVRRWRKACDGLARWFDQVMHAHLQTVTGSNPW